MKNTNWLKTRLHNAVAKYFIPAHNGHGRRMVKRRIQTFTSPEDIRQELRIREDYWNIFFSQFVAAEINEGQGSGQLNSASTTPATDNTASAAELEQVKKEKQDALTEVIDQAVKLKENEAEIAELKTKTEGIPTTVVIDNKITKEKKDIGMQHFKYEELFSRVLCGINTFLVGPAGSGKTTVAEKCAEALKVKFGMMSVGPQTTKSDIFGYMDANGNYVSTEFRKRFEEGGVFLLDEIDAGHGGVLTAVNAALAGSLCAFPDGMVQKHKDFVCIAAGNTYGSGADRQYVGRNQLDAATLDRFDFIDFPYDTALEQAIVASFEGSVEWVQFVQTVRTAVAELKVRHVVSPRASINGAKLLAAGRDKEEVIRTQVWKSLDVATIEKVLNKVRALGNTFLS